VQSLKNEGMDHGSMREYYMSLVEDFTQEIALMSKLKGNPGIVAYEDYTVVEHKDGVGWDILIRMELLHPIAEVLAKREMTEDEVINLGVSLCDALSVCHKNRIIHRDIKIDNIFLSDSGFYKLGDFGVARTIEKTASGLSKKGTYTYMAPEVYKGEAYGQRAELCSLGMVMYRLLNYNREPFLPPPPANVKYNDKNEALIQRMRGDRFAPPQKASPALQQVIMCACDYRAENRFASAEEMKQALEFVKSNPGAPIDLNAIVNRSGAGADVQVSVKKGGSTVPKTDWEKGQSSAGSGITPSAQGSSKAKTAMILGWAGILIEIIAVLFLFSQQWMKPASLLVVALVATAVLVVLMLLFSLKKFSKGGWKLMFVASVVAVSPLNIAAALMYYNDCFPEDTAG
jgi:serine/threonine protein kinase